MRLSIQKMLYKILVVFMISIVLIFFSLSSVSHAKLPALGDGQFYYTGTQEAQYVVKAGLWERLLNALAEIANYLLGIMTLGFRGVVVGWIEIMEIILTALVADGINMWEVFTSGLSGMDKYSQDIVNVEKIIFNEVTLLDANIFKLTEKQKDPNADLNAEPNVDPNIDP